MSKLIEKQIRVFNAKAKGLLHTGWTPPSLVRPPDSTDASFRLILSQNLRELEELEAPFSRAHLSLSEADTNWNLLFNKMTAAERADLSAHIDQFLDDEDHTTTISLLEDELDKFRHQRNLTLKEIESLDASRPRSPSPAPSRSSNSTSFAQSSLVKLPNLKLPTFSGNPTEWPSFWDRFRHTIHDVDDTQLPPVVKFSYLLDCLKDRAYSAVAGLPVQDSSYVLAIDLLQDEFGRKDIVLKRLYENLNSLPPPSSPRLCDIRVFSDNLEKTLLQLENAGESVESTSNYILIQKKLPKDVLRTVIKQESSVPEDQRVRSIRRALKDMLRCEEEVDHVTSQSRSNRPEFVPNRPTHFPASSNPPSRPNFPFRPRSNPPLSNSNPFPFRSQSTNQTRPSPPQQSLTFQQSSQPQRGQRPRTARLPCLFCDSTFHASSICDTYQTRAIRCDKLRELGRCVRCLKPGHSNETCGTNRPCQSCNAFDHNIVLCPQKLQAKPQVHFAGEILGSIDKFGNLSKTQVRLKCVKARVFNPTQPHLSAEALIFLDDGSTTSYITSSLAKRLKCAVTDRKVIQISTFYDRQPKNAPVEAVQIAIQLRDGSSLLVSGNAVRHLTQPIPHCTADDAPRSSSTIPCSWRSPDILIGSDYYHELGIYPSRSHPSGFQILDSKLGQLLGGKDSSTHVTPHLSHVSFTIHSLLQTPPQVSLDDAALKFFSLESLGITDDPQSAGKLSEFQDSIRFDGSRYEVGLPWKKFLPILPSNFGLSFGRLRSVLRTLRSKPKILSKYHEIIREQLQLGIIEPAPPSPSPTILHYLPHQPVIREDKGKVRIVYDASAKTGRDNCLNDCLDPGPMLLENMAGIILRFRTAPVVITCDIEKAFLQVSVDPKDRDALRFLWVRDPSLPEERSNLVSYRFTRVAFGRTCSPFLLAVTISHHLQAIPSPLANEIQPNIYVDNILLTASDASSGHKKCLETKAIFQKAGMNVREFVSNDQDAVSHLQDDDRLSGPLQKFLGIPWHTFDDTLSFSLPIPPQMPVTKRLILSTLASLFDPLGFLSPILLPGKILVQQLWQKKLEWDQTLDEDDTRTWKAMVSSWNDARISIPRALSCLTSPSSLHVFTDASVNAFACCVYMVPSCPSQKCSLIFAKTKVRPAKCQPSFSIHRMELLGVLIGTRVAKFCLSELAKSPNPHFPISNSITLWTDSTTVLHWLCGSAEQETFVENRLRSVRNVPELTCRYVPTADNPADVASRGCTTDELRESPLWWHGPSWLSQPSNWPILVNVPQFVSSPSTITAAAVILPLADPFVDVQRFSSWPKLIRSVAFVLRFCRRISCGIPRLHSRFPKTPDPLSRVPSVPELRSAQIHLFKLAQALDPPDENARENLALFTDDIGLLRSKGRITNSNSSEDAKTPIYLPPHSRITELWVYATHLAHLHTGSVSTLSLIRQKCWIPQGKRTVRRIIRSMCLPCRKLSSLPFQLPPPPALLAERVAKAIPFEHCGIDYFGPLNVKNNGQSSKIWVCLFTCLVVRAIHLEIVTSLNTDECIDAIRRFMARRGIPKTIYSDNGTQLTLASRVLEDRFYEQWLATSQSEPFQNFLSTQGIVWKFITEQAPWRGGFYERLIGIVKEHLRRVLGRTFTTTSGICTIITELESIVNSRPISFSSDDPQNPQPLRPIDFLLLHNSHRTFYPIDEISQNPPATPQAKLLQGWKFASRTIESFWKQWHTDYLLALRERQRRIQNSSVVRAPKAGELILVYENNHPKLQWRTAVVVGGEPSEDGAIRTATIRLPSGCVTRRPINLLFPLEFCSE